MSEILNEILSANKKYASGFKSKSELKSPPKKHFAILTCMDARLDPAKFAGLAEGDAHVIRNAGGRVSDDAIRSLLISHKLLGTDEWFVIQHTSCGMCCVTNEEIDKEFGIENESKKIDWLTFEDNKKCLKEDLEKLKNHSLVPDSIKIHGLIYDVKTGFLEKL